MVKSKYSFEFFLNINNREMSVYFYIQRVFKIRNSEEKKTLKAILKKTHDVYIKTTFLFNENKLI